MSPSDDLPYWTVEDLRDDNDEYADEVLERIERSWMRRRNSESFDSDDMDYPPMWEPGL